MDKFAALNDFDDTLFGEKESDHIVYDNAIEAGNKVIANVGTIKMFGKPRP